MALGVDLLYSSAETGNDIGEKRLHPVAEFAVAELRAQGVQRRASGEGIKGYGQWKGL